MELVDLLLERKKNIYIYIYLQPNIIIKQISKYIFNHKSPQCLYTPDVMRKIVADRRGIFAVALRNYLPNVWAAL